MSTSVDTPFRKLLAFLDRLDQGKVWYRLEHVRDSIMVTAAIPGERWEVEFFEDGTVEIERFRSSGDIAGEDLLALLFADVDGGAADPRASGSGAELQPSLPG